MLNGMGVWDDLDAAIAKWYGVAACYKQSAAADAGAQADGTGYY